MAAALGVRLKPPPKWTPTRAVCHAAKSKTSLAFKDADQPGYSLTVICRSTCHPVDARHALQNTVNMPICRCRSCYEAARWTSSRPVPRTKPAKPAAQKPNQKPISPAELWRSAVTIPVDAEHPARRWLADRYLWRESLELPLTVRWLPKEGLPRRNSAVGALALALAKAGSKRLVAVHLCYVEDGDGKPVPAWSGGPNKNTEAGGADAGGAVGVLGALNGAVGLNVAEGLADALALASRDPQPAVVMAGTANHRNLDVARWLAGIGHVRIWADPGAPGHDAALVLSQRVTVMGGTASVVRPGGGGDPGAAGAPFGRIDLDELKRFAADLELDGHPAFDAERVASCILERGDPDE